MQISASIGIAVSSLMPTIRTIATYLDKANCDDLAQDVAVRLLKSGATKSQLTNRAWLNVVAKRVHIDRWRAERREARYVDKSVGLDLSGSVCEGPEEQSWYAPVQVQAEDMESYLIPIVRQKLQEIPKHQRKALVLHAAGYSYAEISDMTGATVGTVRSRIHYARKRAKQLLKPELE